LTWLNHQKGESLTQGKGAQKEQHVDPVCGMTVDTATAAATSERDGKRYYFCSTGCKARFDAGSTSAQVPVQLSARTTFQDSRHDAAHAPLSVTHAHHETTSRPQTVRSSDREVEQAQEQSYRTMMRKFWFATAVGLPLLFFMFAEFIPALRETLMPYHRAIGIISAIVTFPVLAWSGSQFFESAWNGFRNHNTNMDTLVALGTGAAWAYSTVAVVAPGLFPRGTAGMYFEVAVIVIALILLGQALELKAKSRSSAAIRKLLGLQAKAARVIRNGRELDVPIEEVVIGDIVPRDGQEVAGCCEQAGWQRHPRASARDRNPRQHPLPDVGPEQRRDRGSSVQIS
jgi:Cu+-exporting ATPase